MANNPHIVDRKPSERGSASSAVEHRRRLRSLEGKYGVIGAGATIAGPTISTQTNPSVTGYYPGVVISDTGLVAYSPSGSETLLIDAATGDITITGSGAVISGATFETSSSPPSVVMNSSGIEAFNSSGTRTFFLSGADGSIDISGVFVLQGPSGSATSSIEVTTGGVVISSTTPSISGATVMVTSAGIKGYNSLGTNTVTISSTDGSVTITGGYSFSGSTSSIFASATGLTIGSTTPTVTGAGVLFTNLGIKGYNSSGTLEFDLDATTGLITCTGVITAQPGSAIPVSTTVGQLPGGANRYSNSAFQDGAGNFQTTGWAISTPIATVSSGGTTVPPIYGVLTLELTSTGGSGDIYVAPSVVTDPYKRVVPGLNYSFQHAVWPATTARQCTINVDWCDSSGSTIATSFGTYQNTTLGQWNVIEQTFAAPAGAVYVQSYHYVSLGAVSGEVYYTECYQMEQGDRCSAWEPRADEILYNSITANQIVAGTITAALMDVTTLSAITSNLGSITAGSITSVTINSSTITGGTMSLSGSGVGITLTGSSGHDITINPSAGITFPSGTASFNDLTWVDTGGATVSYIASSIGGAPVVNSADRWWQANAVATGFTAPGSNNYTNVTLAQSAVADQDNFVNAIASNAAQTDQAVVHVIRGDGASSFPQLANGYVGNKVQLWGVGSWVQGTTGSSATVTWPHGLGVLPSTFIAIPVNWVGYIDWIIPPFSGASLDSTDLTFSAASTFGTFTSGDTYYFAYFLGN